MGKLGRYHYPASFRQKCIFYTLFGSDFCQSLPLIFTDVEMEMEEEHIKWAKLWIRKEPDADGYFLLQMSSAGEFVKKTKM